MAEDVEPSAKTGKDNKSAAYDFTVNVSALEEENQLLRQTVQQLRLEVERFRTPPLMVCEVTDVFKDGIVIKIPNGNKFFTAKDESLKLAVGDTVLADQKNLVVIRKIED